MSYRKTDRSGGLGDWRSADGPGETVIGRDGLLPHVSAVRRSIWHFFEPWGLCSSKPGAIFLANCFVDDGVYAKGKPLVLDRRTQSPDRYQGRRPSFGLLQRSLYGVSMGDGKAIENWRGCSGLVQDYVVGDMYCGSFIVCVCSCCFFQSFPMAGLKR